MFQRDFQSFPCNRASTSARLMYVNGNRPNPNVAGTLRVPSAALGEFMQQAHSVYRRGARRIHVAGTFRVPSRRSANSCSRHIPCAVRGARRIHVKRRSACASRMAGAIPARGVCLLLCLCCRTPIDAVRRARATERKAWAEFVTRNAVNGEPTRIEVDERNAEEEGSSGSSVCLSAQDQEIRVDDGPTGQPFVQPRGIALVVTHSFAWMLGKLMPVHGHCPPQAVLGPASLRRVGRSDNIFFVLRQFDARSRAFSMWLL
jgi:hypothetical protein